MGCGWGVGGWGWGVGGSWVGVGWVRVCVGGCAWRVGGCGWVVQVSGGQPRATHGLWVELETWRPGKDNIAVLLQRSSAAGYVLLTCFVRG